VRLRSLIARGYRNLADLELDAPPRGVALLGANAQGKTNLLEAIYYPVLFRSFRGAPDQQVVGNAPGFHVEVRLESAAANQVAVTYLGRKKRIVVDGGEISRVADVVGTWVGVVFLPTDLGLATGAAAVRRQYLDRLLSLASRQYLRALSRYRGAVAQRNSALRQGRADLARAFDPPLAAAGAELVRARLEWVAGASEQFAGEFDCLGEAGKARLQYRGRGELAEADSWESALREALPSDRERRMTTIGPHRDDLLLEIGGRPLRDYGSTGQQRSAAVALKLIEIARLRAAHETEPVVLLDDVFAELDRERQTRLARRLMGPDDRQVFVTSPRRDELPPDLELPVWTVDGGRIL
jgi:DNA replication and repair protein RecF